MNSADYPMHDAEALAEAPGRVNLLGEHTDYNDGFVLPVAIAQRTQVAMRPNGGRHFTLNAQELRQVVRFELDAPPAEHFASYVYGCLALARSEGADIPGLDIAVSSRVPMGVGLSSSAALDDSPTPMGTCDSTWICSGGMTAPWPRASIRQP